MCCHIYWSAGVQPIQRLGGLKLPSAHTAVGLEAYLTRFQWDMAKYPIKQSLKSITEIISKVSESSLWCLGQHPPNALAFIKNQNWHRLLSAKSHNA